MSKTDLQSISDCREAILAIDEQLIALLSQRHQVSDKIGKIKATQGLPIADLNRERLLKAYHSQQAIAHHLDPAEVTELFDIIIAQSKAHQI